MNIIVFDTETTSLEKPFCYNIGYIIADTKTKTKLVEREFVVEQVWHNLPLFQSAYYAEKRPLYISRMKARKVIMDKFGYICQQMIRDIESYNVKLAFAYNSSFDERVFDYNCEWFKCNNPFDNIPIRDIRGFVHNQVAFSKIYQEFCDNNKYYTESGNYSTTAETVYRFLEGNTNFEEEHTALADSQIELEILFDCVKLGCDIEKEYKAYSSIPRDTLRELVIEYNSNGKEIKAVFHYRKKRVYANGARIVLKE